MPCVRGRLAITSASSSRVPPVNCTAPGPLMATGTELLKLPPEKMAGYLISIGGIDEQLAGSLVRAYLFTQRQPMLAMFLDDLKIPHDKGVIAANTAVNLEAEAVKAAVAHLREQFAAADVELYLTALLASDGVTWALLAEELPKAEGEAGGD